LVKAFRVCIRRQSSSTTNSRQAPDARATCIKGRIGDGAFARHGLADHQQLYFGVPMKRILLLAFALALVNTAHAETLLIGNKNEDTVSFVDLASGKERARVKTARAPHEIAISPDGRQAAVVAYGGTTVDIFDVANAMLWKRIDLSPNAAPHGIVWLRDSTLLIATEKSKSLTIVNPKTGKISSVSTDQDRSHMVVATRDGRWAYLANGGSGTVTVIDLAAARKVRDIDVEGSPEGIAITPDGKQLWVGDLTSSSVSVIDTKTLKTLAKLSTDPVAIRVAISPDGKTAATSNIGSGTISMFDVVKLRPLRTVKVSGEQGAVQVTLLFSADGKRLYAAETGRNTIAEVDVASGQVVRRIQAGKGGDGLGIAP
jgi:YVTN family beta-propeller protein